jgi:hypothetical protein
MSLPIRVSVLKKIKYGMAFFAGLFLLSFPATTFYHMIFHPIENVTMAQLREKVIRGEKFYYLRITDVAYNIPQAAKHKKWCLVPLRHDADSSFMLIYVIQDAGMNEAISNQDPSPHPNGLPNEILVADMSLSPVNGNFRDALLKSIENYANVPYVAFEEYEEPILWLDILIALGGIALMYASVRVVLGKSSSETV